MFEGVGFHLRAKGLATNESGLANGIWGTFLFCQTAEAGIGADCNGVPYNAVRYDSPTFGGFSVSTSWGEDDIGDVALKYAADWNSIKVSAAAGYSQSTDERYVSGGGGLANVKQDAKLFQVGASVLHVPSGLFIYGLYQNENANPTPFNANLFNSGVGADNQSDTWYLKGGIKRTWSPLGATVLFGEYAQYSNMYGDVKFADACNGGWLSPVGQNGGISQACATSATGSAFATGSEVKRWGVGVVQEIDSAAMHVYARWQHLDLSVDLSDGAGANLHQDFNDWDLFQVGGVIFF
jgi:hypothetical protein